MEAIYQAAALILAVAGVIMILGTLGLLFFAGIQGLWDWPRRP
jgi:hypothetical protein